MKNVNRYKVYDAYDCYMSGEWDGKPDLLGSGDTREQVEHIIDEREEDTDGEMYIIIYDMFKQLEVSIDNIGCE